MQDITGHNVLITGASRGLGLALAQEFAKRGARIAGVARELAPLESAMAGLRAAGYVAHAIAADVSDPRAAVEVAARAATQLGPLDALIHNASTLGPVPLRPLLETSRAEVAATFAVNLLGPFALTRAVVGGMLVRGRGLVLAISSDAGLEAYPEWGAYGASKAAFDHLLRVWAAELEATGVRFVSVDPGEMNTRMHADAFPDADPRTLAEPSEVALAVADLLASDVTSGSRCSAHAVAS